MIPGRGEVVSLIECESIYGNTKWVPKDQLVFRPAAYAVVLHDGKLLLVTARHGGKYALPGGGVDIDERLQDTLKREVREETGIEIEEGRLLHFEESFFYYDPLDEAFHGLLFFFLCKPRTFDLLEDDQEDYLEAEKPRWVEMSALTENDFQSPAGRVFQMLKDLPSCRAG